MAGDDRRFDEKYETPYGVFEITVKPGDGSELRTRVRTPSGAAFHDTKRGPKQGWQKGHHHKGYTEVQYVTSGWMVVAELRPPNGRKVLRKYGPHEPYVARPGVDHNIYLSSGARIITVTDGEAIGNPDNADGKANDWWPADADFEAWVLSLTEADFERLALE